MKKAFLFSLLLFCAGSADAAHDNGFIYSKTILKIVPGISTVPPETASNSGGLMPALKRAPKEFTVEVRPQSFLRQRDFIARQPFADKEGMLILFDPPSRSKLSRTRMISTADVLFVNTDGIIIKIAPELKLSELTETIDSDNPIRAFVYLKSGAASANDIQIGDRIENSYFKTHPVVIE